MASFWKTLGGIFADSAFEQKSTITTHSVPTLSPDEVRRFISDYGAGGTFSNYISIVYACARVIAEGLALPPCYVNRVDRSGRELANSHPLYYLLNASPNDRQTAYEFREMLGWNLAIHSNAFVYINRDHRGEILELIPLEHGMVSVEVDTTKIGAPVRYLLNGSPVSNDTIWHLKGPSALSYQGQSVIQAARHAIALAQHSEQFGQNLFVNGARPGGVLAPESGNHLTADQAEQIRALWVAQHQGVDNAHKTILLTSGLRYTPMASTANDAQWIETRRFQIEEVSRYMRVSPTKVFQQLGSQSYASVEQAHIAHDQDTDAHWHERFVQSANKHLFTDADRRAGYTITLDNRAALRGTAKERMEYYQIGLQNGVFTQNEVREMEGFDRSEQTDADILKQAVNIYSPKAIGQGIDPAK